MRKFGSRKRFSTKSVRFAGRNPNLAGVIAFARIITSGASERRVAEACKALNYEVRSLKELTNLTAYLFDISVPMFIDFSINSHTLAFLRSGPFNRVCVPLREIDALQPSSSTEAEFFEAADRPHRQRVRILFHATA
ncbi:MAG: hypothetical protein RL189_2173 [Pseudomonadota bacterium]